MGLPNQSFKSWHTVFTDENYTEMHKMQMLTKDKYYLVSGKSPRGIKHMCIYKNGILVHDPHPSKEGITDLTDFQELCKIK